MGKAKLALHRRTQFHIWNHIKSNSLEIILTDLQKSQAGTCTETMLEVGALGTAIQSGRFMLLSLFARRNGWGWGTARVRELSRLWGAYFGDSTKGTRMFSKIAGWLCVKILLFNVTFANNSMNVALSWSVEQLTRHYSENTKCKVKKTEGQLTHIHVPVVFNDFPKFKMARHDSHLMRTGRKPLSALTEISCQTFFQLNQILQKDFVLQRKMSFTFGFFFFDKLDIFTAEGKEKWAWKLKNTWLHPGNCVKAI